MNVEEAGKVRHIFARYLELGSVHALRRDLAEREITSKRWTTSRGNDVGGCSFNRGALFHLLKNPIYIGKIRHKGVIHEGGHEAIVDEKPFSEVQALLEDQAPKRRKQSNSPNAKSILTSKLFDATGEVMTPVFTKNRHGKLYRYYVSASLQQGAKPKEDGVVRRVGAAELESALTEIASRWLPNEGEPLRMIRSIQLQDSILLLDLPISKLKVLKPKLQKGEAIIHVGKDIVRISVPMALPLRGGKKLIITGDHPAGRPDPTLINALRKAHRMLSWKRGLPSLDASKRSQYERKILRMALLAPDLQHDILAGRQPPSLTLEALKQIDIPIDWSKQREALGWNVAN